MVEACAAISVGIVDGVPVLDLPYVEDSRAEVDMNVVMTEGGRFVEVQGTAEGLAFTRGELDSMLALAEAGHRRDRRPAARARGRRRPSAALRLLLATGNAHKVAEIAAILGPGFDVEAVDPGVEETGRHVRGQRAAEGAGRARRHRRARRRRRLRHRGRRPRRRPGRPLGRAGRQGDEVGMLLRALVGVPAERRGCRYVCAAAVARPDGTEAVVRGAVAGVVADDRAGRRRLRLRPDRRAPSRATAARSAR